MSEKLVTIKGKYEIPIGRKYSSTYTDSELLLTSFYGGKRGQCIQLTITNCSGYSDFIQLNKKSVKKLVEKLKIWIVH